MEAEKWETVANAIDHLFHLEIVLLEDEEELAKQTDKLKERLVWRALWKLAETGRLVGAELTDECGDVYGVVTKLERCVDGYWVTYDGRGDHPWPTGGDLLSGMASCPEGAPFRPAGSDHYRELGTAALLREYAKAIEAADPEVQQLKKEGLWLTEPA